MIDSCCYSKSDLSGNRLFICVWVDDIIYFSTSSDLAESFKKCFSEKFKIEDKGSMKWFLGVSVDQSPGKITFSQKCYILDLLCCFGTSDCNPCDLPMTANTRIDKSSCTDLESDTFEDLSKIRSLYMFLHGKLNYLSVVSRPDLSFVVSSSSQVLKKPSHDHWLLAKKVLVIKHSECLKLVGFCDSDWGGDPNDRRSTSGYCFKISDDSSVICWSSRKQQTVALSSTEAEYMSISLACQEWVYLLSLVKSLGLDLDGSTLLQGDNHGAIKLAQNPITHSRSKRNNIKQHFVRDLVEREVGQLQYIPTHQNIADFLTKALGHPISISSEVTSFVNQYSIIEGACWRSMKLFTYRDVCKLVGIDRNSINNSRSQQSNLSIQATKMKWTETKYLPGLRILPSSITFNFDNMNPWNEDYVSSQEFIMNWIVTTETELLL